MIHGSASTEKSVVLIVHGYFSANKIGPNRLYVRIADELNCDGFMVVRCDLSGMGESEGRINEITFEDHVLDLKGLILFLKEQYGKNIILIGHSIGCLLAIESTAGLQDCIERNILIAPVFSTDKILNRLFDEEMLRELKTRGSTYRKGVYVDYSFFDENVNLDRISRKMMGINVPTLILGGRGDQFVAPQDLNELCVIIKSTPVIISRGDHNFTDLESRDELIDEIKFFLN